MIMRQRTSYELRAIISFPDVLTPLTVMCPAARSLPLKQDLALIPVTEALTTSLDCGHAQLPPETGFQFLTTGVYEALRVASIVGPISYIEANYTATGGRQAAAIWAQRLLAYGPTYLHPSEPFPADGTAPILEALRRLGAMPEDRCNEFVAVGLGRYSNTLAWHEAAAPVGTLL